MKEAPEKREDAKTMEDEGRLVIGHRVADEHMVVIEGDAVGTLVVDLDGIGMRLDQCTLCHVNFSVKEQNPRRLVGEQAVKRTIK